MPHYAPQNAPILPQKLRSYQKVSLKMPQTPQDFYSSTIVTNLTFLYALLSLKY